MDKDDVTPRQPLQPPSKVGVSAVPKPNKSRWVQTERAAHEAWGKLIAKHPRAAQLMHFLVAYMGNQNALVISQKTLAELMGVSVRTMQRAAVVLEQQKWIQVVQVGKGKERVYVVNSRVAWGQKRDQLYLSSFTAQVVLNADEQEIGGAILAQPDDLRTIPSIYQGEQIVLDNSHDTPPTQEFFDGMAPKMPMRQKSAAQAEREDLEQHGQKRLIP